MHLVTPEVVADLVVEAAGPDAASAHSVRPVRVDDRMISVSVEHLGHLVTAAAQAGKYVGTNGGGPAAAHLLDLATEIGAALVHRHSDDAADLPVGVLDELAHLVDAVAACVESGDWSICPCGRDHGQRDTDTGTTSILRHHAALTHGLCRKGE